MFGIPFKPFPLTAMFRLVVEETHLPQYKLDAIAFASLTDRILILLKWKDETSPTYTHWIRDLMQLLKLKKYIFTLRGSTDTF